MPIVISGKSVNKLFIKVAKKLITIGEIRVARGLKTVELSDVFLTLDDPTDAICTLQARDINYEYLAGEMEWYESGSLFVDDIGKHSSFWCKLADSNGTVNSNYGFLTKVEKHAGISQFEWCVNRLKKDKYTRQAIMNYNQPKHKYEDVKDFVCTISQSFIVRDEKLDSVVLMRSNDLIYGLTYDIVWFTELQIEMAKLLDIPLGKYHHFDISLHVYERHFDMLEKIARSNIE